jgi:hypothetical protein
VEDLHEKSLRNLFRGTVQANWICTQATDNTEFKNHCNPASPEPPSGVWCVEKHTVGNSEWYLLSYLENDGLQIQRLSWTQPSTQRQQHYAHLVAFSWRVWEESRIRYSPVYNVFVLSNSVLWLIDR